MKNIDTKGKACMILKCNILFETSVFKIFFTHVTNTIKSLVESMSNISKIILSLAESFHVGKKVNIFQISNNMVV